MPGGRPGYLDRLVARVQATGELAQPLVRSRFAPRGKASPGEVPPFHASDEEPQVVDPTVGRAGFAQRKAEEADFQAGYGDLRDHAPAAQRPMISERAQDGRGWVETQSSAFHLREARESGLPPLRGAFAGRRDGEPRAAEAPSLVPRQRGPEQRPSESPAARPDAPSPPPETAPPMARPAPQTSGAMPGGPAARVQQRKQREQQESEASTPSRPDIHIRIQRVEIRAVQAVPEKVPAVPASSLPALSINEYLKRREAGR